MAATVRPSTFFKQLCSLYKTASCSQVFNTVNQATGLCKSKVTYDRGISFCVNRAFHSTALVCSRRFQEFSTVTETKVAKSDEKPTDNGVIQHVNNALQSPDVGRLFAVVSVRGKQRKITTEDIIVVEGDFPPTVGDRIRLEKVLMVGSKDFTLVGRPLLSRNMVNVEATVVEKTLSHFRVHFYYIRRKNYKTLKVRRTPYTMLVINSIDLLQADIDS